MRCVIIESPYAGDTELHVSYLRACMRCSLMRGESPFASHAMLAARHRAPARISLTRGYVTIIDAADVELVSQFKWLASGRDGGVYAGRNVRTGPKQRMVLLHRFLTGAAEGVDVDHINGNRLDNRRRNLRCCTHAENSRNTRRPTNNTSGFKGVSRQGVRWRAQIVVNDKQKYLGAFDAPENAARAYDQAAVSAFGAFARLNFPLPEPPWVLDDTDPVQRELGIQAGFEWRRFADATIVYTDLGISGGMRLGIEHAVSIGHPIEYRTLPAEVVDAIKAQCT